MIDPTLDLAVSTQCQLLGLARSTYYYESTATESDFNLALMEEIDRLYLAHPENGSRMMTKVLRRRGHHVNRKRVQRLMQLMGLRSLCPQPKITTPNKAHDSFTWLHAAHLVSREVSGFARVGLRAQEFFQRPRSRESLPRARYLASHRESKC